MPARSVCLVTLSLSEAGPGRFGCQSPVTDIYHTIHYTAPMYANLIVIGNMHAYGCGHHANKLYRTVRSARSKVHWIHAFFACYSDTTIAIAYDYCMHVFLACAIRCYNGHRQQAAVWQCALHDNHHHSFVSPHLVLRLKLSFLEGMSLSVPLSSVLGLCSTALRRRCCC